MLQEYLVIGGNEVVNSQRAYGYGQTAGCPATWLRDPQCSTIADAQQDVAYDYANISDAPWYDPDDPDTTGRFLGLTGVKIAGLSDSTRTAESNEKTTDGGVVSGYRHATREVRVQGWLTAAGMDALEYGHTWLRNVLEPDACGIHGGDCGEAEAAFFVDCPPARRDVTLYTDWALEATNLATNPSFESTSGTVEVRRNLALDPNGTAITNWYSVGSLAATRTVDTSVFHLGTSAIRSTLTAGGSAAFGLKVSAGSQTFVAGDVVQFSGWVYSSKNMTVYAIAERTPTYANMAGPAIALVANTWTKVSFTFTVTAAFAGAETYGFGVYNPGSAHAVGDFIIMDEVLVEKSSTVDAYFDGGYRPRLRENLEWNPSLTLGTSTWSMTGGAVRQAPAGPLGTPGFALVRTASSTPLAQKTAGAVPVSPGDSLSFSATGVIPAGGQISMDVIWRDGSGVTISTSSRARLVTPGDSGTGTITPAPSDTPTRFGHTVVAPAGAVTATLRAFIDAGPAVFTAYITDFLVEMAAVPGEFFSGASVAPAGFGYAWSGAADASPSYLYDADLTPAWTGTANASASVLTGLAPVGAAGSGAVRISSTQWSASGTRSLRLHPNGATTDTFASPGGDSGAFRLGMAPGRTYTVLATIRLAQAQVTGDVRARRIRAFVAGGVSGAGVAYESAQADNVPGEYELRLTFTVPADATSAWIRLYNGASGGNGEVWWDNFAVVEGTYEGDYFDGSTPDTDLTQFTWTGTADASTSTYETRSSYIAPEGDDTYFPYVDTYRRFLHSVRAVSGPFEVESRESVNGVHVGRLVEFTLLAEVPFVFGVPKELSIPPIVPTVIQDIPYNLAPYPSAELSAGTVVTATNYSTNPSLETDAAGWTATVDGTNITSAMGSWGRVTGELAAAGVASYRFVFTATGAGTNGWFGAQQTVTLGGGAGARYSFNMWSAEVIMAGAPVQGAIEVHAIWQDAGSATLRTDLLGTIPVAGGAVSVKSVAPPAGATKVIVRARANLTSWNAGTIVRLYSDALAVTVP